jgi:hypothetical protein
MEVGPKTDKSDFQIEIGRVACDIRAVSEEEVSIIQPNRL